MGRSIEAFMKFAQTSHGADSNTQTISEKHDKINNIAVCCIIKDEAENILEWIAYYRVIGVNSFFIYNNFSTDNISEILAPLVSEGYVTLIDWPFKPGQTEAYNDFARRFGHDFKWGVFVDADEYINIFDGRSLTDYLGQFDDFAGVTLQWLNFGPSGHMERPLGLSIENYLTRLPEDEYPAHGHVKSIIRMKDYVRALDPHSFEVHGVIVTEHKQPVLFTSVDNHYSIQPIAQHDQACVNHYYTRSASDWEKKMRRGLADQPEDSKLVRANSLFAYTKERAVVRDERIMPLVQKVKDELAAMKKLS